MSEGSSARDLRQWLKDIVEWHERMSDHVRGMDEDSFHADRRTQDAVIRCLACMGEASRQVLNLAQNTLPPGTEFVQAYWTRNRLVHGYYDVDVQRVWLTATQSAPALAADAKKILNALD